MADYHVDHADSVREHHHGVCVGIQPEREEEQIELFQGLFDLHGRCGCALPASGSDAWNIFIYHIQQLLLLISAVKSCRLQKRHGSFFQ